MVKLTMLLGRLSPERNPIPFQLAEELSRNGFVVEIIAGYPSRGISQEVINQYMTGKPIQWINRNFFIRRVGSKRLDKGNLIQRARDYLNLTYTIFKEAKSSKTDVYLIYSSPPFLMLLTNRLKKRAPVVLNIQDLFPYSLLALLSNPQKLLIKKLLVSLMKRSYLKSDGIVTVSDDMKQSLVSMGVEANHIDVAYNWANFSSVYHVPANQNPLFNELELDVTKKYVVYAGNLGKFQAIECVLELAKASLEFESDYHYLIFGDGTEKTRIERLIEEFRLKNVTLLPLQPPEKVKYVYSIGVFNILSLRSGVIRYAHPSKTAYLLATGVPILAFLEPECELARYIEGNSVGVVFSNKVNTQNFKEGLEKLKSFYSDAQRSSANGEQQAIAERYSLKRSGAIYAASVLKNIDKYRKQQ